MNYIAPSRRLRLLLALAVLPAFSAATAAPAAAAENSQAQVLMYTTQTCGYCAKARQFLSARHVAWREVDIESSAAAKAEFDRRGGVGTPLIYVDDERVTGFDPQRLEKVLRAHGKLAEGT